MQWNVEELQGFEAVRPYYDSAILPHYIFDKKLSIATNAARMGYLSSLAMAVEQRLKGRVVLFPLMYQIKEDTTGPNEIQLPNEFGYNFILRFSGIDVHIPVYPDSDTHVEFLTISDEDLESEIRFQITSDVLYQEILQIWQNHKK
ncbi:DUF2487 family protein [Brevibacillus laterosporus]|uniref:DUF2487 family protein n=1 Tax=Brevibacillus laterosporus TaxID=1465 RepID=UPI00037C4AD5|nr:DUF2487 family protein [Brevibacillus laterosporus]ATO51220.1 hypothetical protein BrL25_20235 [Brevibacillus laterosporus DSM 25]MBG9804156.1 hypothetical protein [Brevibacillus laterosporus]MED2004134.1 DUF2487 family protein [Brevibacillus laterosporus]MED4763351.1 DUF2487 family protein [Brevibacillus laterosporus]TPH14818.1 DUF2487 family protein [Brevibacillus laterosporus]